jgi:hypothetical protein
VITDNYKELECRALGRGGRPDVPVVPANYRPRDPLPAGTPSPGRAGRAAGLGAWLSAGSLAVYVARSSRSSPGRAIVVAMNSGPSAARVVPPAKKCLLPGPPKRRLRSIRESLARRRTRAGARCRCGWPGGNGTPAGMSCMNVARTGAMPWARAMRMIVDVPRKCCRSRRPPSGPDRAGAGTPPGVSRRASAERRVAGRRTGGFGCRGSCRGSRRPSSRQRAVEQDAPVISNRSGPVA